jgi:hypothetical protein
MGTPRERAISFSGISPTDSIRVSQSMSRSVPGIVRIAASTLAVVTPVTRREPWTAVTVDDSSSGMP